MGIKTCLKSICNARIVWFSFLAIRLATLYVAEMPWEKMYIEFQCTVDTSMFCRKACFKAHFEAPMVSVWTFTYILFIISVLLMELFSSHLHYNLNQVKMQKAELVEDAKPASFTGFKMQLMVQKDMLNDLHQQMLMLVLYLAYVLLRLHIEMAFLYILVMWHVPKIVQSTLVCSTWLCPGPYDCVLRSSMEKRIMVFMLCSISIIIICSYLSFAFYSICYYVFIGRSHLVKSK